MTHSHRFCIFLFLFSVSQSVLPSALFADTKTQSSQGQTQLAPVTYAADTGDPAVELEKIRQDFNRVFQWAITKAGRGLDWAETQQGVFNPRMDLIEERERFLLKFDVPGVQKEKLDLKVTDKTLTVSGERQFEAQTTDPKTGAYQQERRFGNFERTLAIPENVRTDKISAKYDLGVLTVELPKIKPTIPEAEKTRKIQIN